jgi:hypothetical protein
MWQVTNPVSRDFRHGYNPSLVWTSSVLSDTGGGNYVGSVPYPATGATAFLVELTYPSGIVGMPYVFTTDVRVNSDLPRTPFPYSADSSFGASPTVTSASLIATVPDDQGDGAVQAFVLPSQAAVETDEAATAAPAITTVSPAADIASNSPSNTADWSDGGAIDPSIAGKSSSSEANDAVLDDWPAELAV